MCCVRRRSPHAGAAIHAPFHENSDSHLGAASCARENPFAKLIWRPTELAHRGMPMARKSSEKNYLKARAGKTTSNFGRIVAEQDSELQDYYVDPDRYVARALDFNDSAVFFVGPKGAGKSAILQMVRLSRAADEGRIINISPDDLAFSALANVSATTPILSEVAKHQWLFKSLWDYESVP
jgi:hypothetical protein